MNKRHILTMTLLLTALMVAGNAMAEGEQTTPTGVTIGGSVYGGGNKAGVKMNTTVNMGGGQVEGNVYGGGNQGDVGTINKTDANNYKWTNATGVVTDPYTYNNTGACTVSITNGTVGRVEGNQDADHGNVFGGGKGLEDTYECEKAMVYKATVIIGNGTVKRNVYGGGKVGRVENDTQVTLGLGEESDGSTKYYEKQTGEGGTVTYNEVTVAAGQSVVGKYVRSGVEGSYVYTLIAADAHPVVEGSVFGAGAGTDKHGYSALVRGDASVTVQGNASVKKNVYGGGEMATVGRYWVSVVAADPNDPAPSTMPPGMPYKTKGGGACTVNVLGNAIVGPEGAASETAGHVFGAGQGVVPSYYLGNVEVLTDTASMPKRMMRYSETYKDADRTKTWEYYGTGTEFVWEYFNTREKYFNFLQSLALATETHVTINGTASPTSVKGSVYGGSESGFVQDDTDVKIQAGTIGTSGTYGNVFGGGKGLLTFAEAGKVKGNTEVAISGGTMHGTVYGGGELGHVGIFSYVVNQQTGSKTYTWTEGGTCNVTIDALNDNTTSIKGNVFGAGKGSSAKYECEPAMVLQSNVTINNGTVDGTVYGGGEIGRVDQNTTVTIGKAGDSTSEPDIKGSVFGAGAGLQTHGYSALVRGNSTVTVQGKAKVGKSVYGGGETASVGRFVVVNSLPKQPVSGGICTVTIKDNATIGTSSTRGDVYGACKGVEPDYSNATGHVTDDENLTPFTDEDDYLSFLQTLALTSNTEVSISGSASVNGSVYGGGRRGITLAGVKVNMTGGTVTEDVYGGGALANTNTENWDDTNNTLTSYHVETRLTRPSYQVKEVEAGESVEGLYIKDGDEYNTASGTAVNGTTYYEKVPGSSLAGYYTKSGNEYTLLTSGTADESTTYYRFTDTKVYLLGGTIMGDAYGGGLGRLAKAAVTADPDNNIEGQAAVTPVEAKVYGDVLINLNGMAADNYDAAIHNSYVTGIDKNGDNKVDYYRVGSKGCIVDRVFGCNNLNGTPKGNVTVHVYATQHVDKNSISAKYSKALEQETNEALAAYLLRLINATKKDENTYMTGVNSSVITTAQEVQADAEATEARLNTAIDNVKKELMNRYDVRAVYGGGNEAAYIPTTPYEPTEAPNGSKNHVIIEGCYFTSIETVYGGGNAAPAPETNVDIYSTYEIESVFGGGNGKDRKESDNSINPGANVGMYNNGTTNVKYGTGSATTMIYGGTVHEAYGGSNEKGTIYGDVVIDVGANDPNDPCTLNVGKLVGAGKNADVFGDLKIIMGCKPYETIPLVFGGADNANVNGDVELTVTSGNFGKIFGGNNNGGRIKGHIILNIEETTCIPLNIDHLYLCGNNAAYSQYGYYVLTTKEGGTPIGDPAPSAHETPVLTEDTGKLQLIPRESAADPHKPVNRYSYDETTGEASWEVYNGRYDDTKKIWEWEVSSGVYKDALYASPVLNVISCTSIDEVFGGGYGADATVYGDPTVNINMIPGDHADEIDRDGDDQADGDDDALGAIGDVFGGGDAAAVYGNTTVNIGTVKKVDVYEFKKVNDEYKLQYEADGVTPKMKRNQDVVGAYITGNVYGGGKEANVTGNTYVNVCAYKNDDNTTPDVIEYSGVTISGTGIQGVIIKGDVFGGGKGVTEAAGVEGAFECAKAMVGVVNSNDGGTDITKESTDKGTRVSIGNGTVEGSVYGGGEVGRVEWNSVITVGLPVGNGETSHPEIKGNVFGGGKGVEQYGYAALLRGNTFVTVQANAKVGHSVYGGGEIASVGKYNIVKPGDLTPEFQAEHPGLGVGMPWSLANQGSGYCNVTIRGNAEIGPDDMKMFYADGKAPDDEGHVFGAGKGVLPYENEDDFECQHSGHNKGKHPGRMTLGNVWECFETKEDPEAAYLSFIETQALATQTEVTIDGNAFVKGSVYGGSLSGHVQHNTHVTIAGECQIGAGFDTSTNRSVAKYTNWPTNTDNITESWNECAHWDYVASDGSPYDRYAKYKKTVDGKDRYYYDVDCTEAKYANGGSSIAKDGHTYYGNVFGGGSGVVPYKPGQWHREAGTVGGNTVVDITGGHILTNVYGGNEHTDVGSYDNTNSRALLAGTGSCTINMTGGTVGVPRTLADIAAHPVTCYVFGAGKGDSRTDFNTWTNVGSTQVNISGTARIYGSTFGGGEDGHVLGDVETNIGGTVTIGSTSVSHSDVIIGTQGKSGADGNIFGGGRGFSEDALTAGVVVGNVTVNIHDGKMLGTVYGGGRLASVGTYLAAVGDTEHYGKMQGNSTDMTHGVIRVNIDGGTIGATYAEGDNAGKLVSSDFSIGDVFGGCKGSTSNNLDFGLSKHTFITMTGGRVNGSVYGGGEVAMVEGNTTVNVSGGYVGDGVTEKGGAKIGNVYGGGKGNLTTVFAGLIKGNTNVTISNTLADAEYAQAHDGVSEGDLISEPTIYHNIYGGGAYGSVGTFTATTGVPTSWTNNTGTANVTITGGIFGFNGNENGMVFGSSRGDVATPTGTPAVDPNDKLAWVHDTHVTIGSKSSNSNDSPWIKGSVYGSGENGHVFTNTVVDVHSGTIGIFSGDSFTVNGESLGGADYPYRGNVYGGGCGEDTYTYTYSEKYDYDEDGDIDDDDREHDVEAEAFNPLAGVVLGTANVNIDGGKIAHNVYGAGALGSVGKITKSTENNTETISFDSGTGTTTIVISDGQVGDDGEGDGNVYGAARGNVNTTQTDVALVYDTDVTIAATANVKGSVYGGGETGDVKNNTSITMSGGSVGHNVFGGGKGSEHNYLCDKAMVGVMNSGAGQNPASDGNKDKGTIVTITAGTVGTLNNGNLVDGTGNVYGGGEIGRVEWNTQVTIGVEDQTSGDPAPVIYGSVFGAGAGNETHGFAGLVRGNSTVIIQGKAKVQENVYGGGEMATAGRYWVKGAVTPIAPGETQPTAPGDLPSGMPYATRGGGVCTVTVQDKAQIGPDAGASATAGHVFGAGQGVNPHFSPYNEQDKEHSSRRMADTDEYVYFTDDSEDVPEATRKTGNQKYLEFLQTLALATETHVTISESAQVKGNVYGGSESGFVQDDTDLKIQGGEIGTTTYGNVFGGGKGLEEFGEAGKVKGNATVAVSSGTITGNVYGGGELGHIGTFTETADGRFVMQKIEDKNGDEIETGLCTVSVTGGKIGPDNNTDKDKGNVFGAGKGKDDTFKCEKAMVMNAIVSVSDGTVNGNVYGGGEVGRVEYDTEVTLGRKSTDEANAVGTGKPDIKGSVYGAGRGVATHGYSALVRGNTKVTIDGAVGSKVGHSVYGGGEIASVGRYGLDSQKMPSILLGGGECIVNVQGNVIIGPADAPDEKGNVFGAGKGVDSNTFNNTDSDKSKRSRRMTMYNPADFPADNNGNPIATSQGTTWEYYKPGSPFVWEYYQSETAYSAYLETLALATHPEVTIGGNATVNGSVFGGGELGLTKGSVVVTIKGGTIEKDVYGGGSLANTNTTSSVGETDEDGAVVYRNSVTKEIATKIVHPTTIVKLLGGEIKGEAYGGGLGQLASGDAKAIEALVMGDVLVDVNGETNLTIGRDGGKTWPENIGNVISSSFKGCIVKYVFGCNNINGSPKKNVTVHVYATQRAGKETISAKEAASKGDDGEWNLSTFDVKAVYGGGNMAAYVPAKATGTDEEKATAHTNVIIDGCNLTSIGQVYGGGNAASVPATNVVINGTYEIGQAFGGGNGKDKLSDGSDNPGANVGYYTYPNAANDAYDTKENREQYYSYGSGLAHITVYGGKVHSVYGGSNTKGNVRVEARTTLEDVEQCPFDVGEAFGGGRNAEMDGDAVLEIGCISGLEKAYGGAANADVNGDVVLNITNGTYGRVFGGNDLGGNITGSITVNIEETGCRPIIIGELYGGGNEAGYSIYGYKKVTETDEATGETVQVWRPRESTTDSPAGVIELSIPATQPKSPQVNVKSFTSIGNIFGGGYGKPALMVGSPEVNINVAKGKYAETFKGNANVIVDNARIVGSTVATSASVAGYDSGYPIPSHAAGAIGAINNVFGGGNAAEVIGTPHVNIGTLTGEVITLSTKIEDSEGRTPSDEGWVPSYQIATAEGIDIRGDVFGGGNAADVTGDTEVVIGKNNSVKTYSFTSYGSESGNDAWSSGLAQTTGTTETISDKKYAEVVILTNGKYGEYVGKKFYVDPEGTGRLQLYDADKQPTSLWVEIKQFEQKKTYSFTSYGAENGGSPYSTGGTATATGNFKTFGDKEYMQIVVLTNPGEVTWVGKTFYVPTDAKTDGTTRTQLYKADGTAVGVWVSISIPQ